MKSKIVTYTKKQIKKMKSRTDEERLREMTDEEIERNVAQDPDAYIPTDNELKEFKPKYSKQERIFMKINQMTDEELKQFDQIRDEELKRLYRLTDEELKEFKYKYKEMKNA